MFKDCKPFTLLPKIIYPVYAGYNKFDGGLAITWLNKMVYIIKPINERI